MNTHTATSRADPGDCENAGGDGASDGPLRAAIKRRDFPNRQQLLGGLAVWSIVLHCVS
jgi:hypothetical protein